MVSADVLSSVTDAIVEDGDAPVRDGAGDSAGDVLDGGVGLTPVPGSVVSGSVGGGLGVAGGVLGSVVTGAGVTGAVVSGAEVSGAVVSGLGVVSESGVVDGRVVSNPSPGDNPGVGT